MIVEAIQFQQTTHMKRTTSVKEFGKLLDDRMKELNRENDLSLRILSVSSPKSGGDVEIVFDDNKAITYRSDGTFTGLSYWHESQI